MRTTRLITTVRAVTAAAAALCALTGAAAVTAPGASMSTSDADARAGSPAQAVSGAKKACRSNRHGAKVCFHPRGDHFYLKDTRKDGMSAVVYWKTSYGRTGECVNVHGKGVVVDCNYNMREDFTVRFWAVNSDRPSNTYRYWSKERASTI